MRGQVGRAYQHRRDQPQVRLGGRARQHAHVPQTSLPVGVQFGQPPLGPVCLEARVLVFVPPQHGELVGQISRLGAKQVRRVGHDKPAEWPAHERLQRRLEQRGQHRAIGPGPRGVTGGVRVRRYLPARARRPDKLIEVGQHVSVDHDAMRAPREQHVHDRRRLTGTRRGLIAGSGRACRQRPGVGDQLKRRSAAPRQPASDERPPVAGRVHDRWQHGRIVAVGSAAEVMSADGLDPVPESGRAAADARLHAHAACLPGRLAACYRIQPKCDTRPGFAQLAHSSTVPKTQVTVRPPTQT